MSSHPIHDDTGFTLTELLTVLALTVVTMTIVAPPTARGMHESQLRSATNEVLAAHTFARTMAVQHGRSVELVIGSGGKAQNSRDNVLSVRADTTVAGTGRTVVHTFAPRKAEIISDRTRLCFDPRGLPLVNRICEEPDATVVVKVAGRADTIRMSPIGEPLP